MLIAAIPAEPSDVLFYALLGVFLVMIGFVTVGRAYEWVQSHRREDRR